MEGFIAGKESCRSPTYLPFESWANQSLWGGEKGINTGITDSSLNSVADQCRTPEMCLLDGRVPILVPLWLQKQRTSQLLTQGLNAASCGEPPDCLVADSLLEGLEKNRNAPILLKFRIVPVTHTTYYHHLLPPEKSSERKTCACAKGQKRRCYVET